MALVFVFETLTRARFPNFTSSCNDVKYGQSDRIGLLVSPEVGDVDPTVEDGRVRETAENRNGGATNPD